MDWQGVERWEVVWEGLREEPWVGTWEEKGEGLLKGRFLERRRDQEGGKTRGWNIGGGQLAGRGWSLGRRDSGEKKRAFPPFQPCGRLHLGPHRSYFGELEATGSKLGT